MLGGRDGSDVKVVWLWCGVVWLWCGVVWCCMGVV